jgi:transcriptional regulator with XRE-family HTH domain
MAANGKDSPTMIIFRDRVRKLIELRDTTMEDIAEKAHITREHLSRILNGHYTPKITVAEDIAQALGLSLVELLAEKKSKKTA